MSDDDAIATTAAAAVALPETGGTGAPVARGQDDLPSSQNDSNSGELLEGVVFHRTVRSVYAVVLLAIDDTRKAVVRIQIKDGTLATELRSWCRRTCKIGDLLVLRGHWAQLRHEETSTDWKEERFVVDIYNEADAAQKVRLKEAKHWDMVKCQAWQKRFIAQKNNQETKKRQRVQQQLGESPANKAYRHGGGIGKRKQGEQLANFLIHVVMHKLGAPTPPSSDWATVKPSFHAETLQWLNRGSGVVDAAGGSGHVSMALGLLGIRSTVVDPRENVGKLPGKDRKVYNKAVKNNINRLRGSNMVMLSNSTAEGIPLCGSTVAPYQSLRAWFASKPDGVDTSFRCPDEESVEVCFENHALLQDCSAIIALHPDEATDSIVDMAVKKRVPFAIMPCCVFSRLFPDRRVPDSAQPVRTYDELIEYLVAKDVAIQKTVLPFEGANIALWATFS